ncbi:hypothetical protein N136_01843 [Leifsonia aquatica ATCC 14665]|uniref:Uncharacterized protein n=1 Tax=Leifsonia aquatica ATCC 14665 TaxID=1358026 RepID=U2R978_LEIAQ|nr:hypothetical protein N136_01843 [Leifsonia aquatica ATCC 14665]
MAALASLCMLCSFSRPDLTTAQASALDWSVEAFAAADGFDEADEDDDESPDPPAEQPVRAAVTVAMVTAASARRAPKVFFMVPLCWSGGGRNVPPAVERPLATIANP